MNKLIILLALCLCTATATKAKEQQILQADTLSVTVKYKKITLKEAIASKFDVSKLKLKSNVNLETDAANSGLFSVSFYSSCLGREINFIYSCPNCSYD